MEDLYCDSDYNNVILFTVINTFYTCQAYVDIQDDSWYVYVCDAE